MRRWVVLLLLLATPVWAATPYSLDVSWTAPTTNNCSTYPPVCPTCTPPIPPCPTALTDLAGYRLYVSAPCPSQQYAVVPTPTSRPAPGDTVSVTVNGLTPAKTYTAQITAVDTAGTESACSTLASGSTLAPGPPLPLGSLALAFRSSTAAAAVAIEGSVGSHVQASASTTNDVTLTVTAGTEIVAMIAIDGNTTVSGAAWDPTGVNEAASLIIRKSNPVTLGSVEVWALKSPTAKTATFRFTLAASQLSVAGGYSLTGVDTAIAFASYSQNSSNGTGAAQQPSISGLTAGANDLTLDVYQLGVGTTESLTVGAGQTSGFNANISSGTSSGGSSSKAASTAMSWSNALAGDDWAYAVIVVPAAGGAARGLFRPAEQLTGTGIGGAFFRTVPD